MPLTDSQRAEYARLVSASPVVLFMKGNRRFPACGFSATVVGILDKVVPDFQTIDILQDPGLREGMKEFSSWPTFPQLYVRGEFVGGCDIVKEIYASGELAKLVSGIGPAPTGAGAALPAQPTPTEAPTTVTLTATPSAVYALQQALAGAEGEVLRLEISPSYENDLHIGPKQPGDIAVDLEGVVLHVASASAGRAQGVRLDFVDAGGGDMAFKIDNPNAPPPVARVKKLGAVELKAMLDGGKAHLFDVRPEGERAIASIAAATSLDDRGRAVLDALERDAPIVLHCHHGMRSRAAAERLVAEGFTNVYNLEGGIEAWSRDVDPSVPRY